MQGTLLDGRFRIEALRASGALFDTYDGKDLKSRAPVIIRIARDAEETTAAHARLRNALPLWRDLAAPGIAALLRSEALLQDELIPYLAREASPWPSLSDRMADLGKEPTTASARVACRAGLEIAVTIALCHAKGLHGGLHPKNVFIDPEGRTKLTDIGVSDLACLPAPKGDPRSLYLPEEAREGRRPLVPSDDLYAWGALMFALLTGRSPDSACDRRETAAMEERYQGLGIDVAMRAFHHDATRRFHDAKELLAQTKTDLRLLPVEREAPPMPAAPSRPAPPATAAEIVASASPASATDVETEARMPENPPAITPAPSIGKGPSIGKPTITPHPLTLTPRPSIPKPAITPRASEKPSEASVLKAEIARRQALLQSQSHYDMLGVARDASDDDIRQSFKALARRLHPDRLRTMLEAKERAAGEALFESLSEAYSVLSDESQRKLYDIELIYQESAAKRVSEKGVVLEGPRDRAAAADEYVRDGKALASKGDVWGAAQAIRQALLIDPLRADFHLELGRVLLMSPRWHREAERALKRVLELSPGNAEIHYTLGTLYRDHGMEIRAQDQFRRASEIDPENPRYASAQKP